MINSRQSGNTQGFTLVELLVAITLLSVIMVSVFETYTQIIMVNKRMEMDRLVQDAVRTVTEKIANDIREKGIDFAYYDNSDPIKRLDYAGWNQVLAIRWGGRYYAMKYGTTGEPILCTPSDFPTAKCFVGYEAAGEKRAITDDSIRLDNFAFYLSGLPWSLIGRDGQTGKATLTMSVGVKKGKWLASKIADQIKLSVQTTVSEKVYRSNIR